MFIFQPETCTVSNINIYRVTTLTDNRISLLGNTWSNV